MQVLECACANRASVLIRWTSLTPCQFVFEKFNFKSQMFKVLDKINEEDEERTDQQCLYVLTMQVSR